MSVSFVRKVRLITSRYGIFRALELAPFLPSLPYRYICYSDELSFVYYIMPKVASRTIRGHLYSSGADVRKQYYPSGTLESYYHFTFVRNPWDRLVSCWRDKVVHSNLLEFGEAELERMQDFGNFVDYVESVDVRACNPHFRLQVEMVDFDKLDYVGRFESLEDDLQHVLQHLSIPLGSLMTRGVRTKKNYRDLYTDELAERVGVIYKDDIEAFSYAF